MFIAKLAACIFMIPHPGLYFKRSEPLPVFQIVDSGFYDACCFGKKEDSCGDFGEVQDTLQIFGGTITIGGVLLYSCVEKRR